MYYIFISVDSLKKSYKLYFSSETESEAKIKYNELLLKYDPDKLILTKLVPLEIVVREQTT